MAEIQPWSACGAEKPMVTVAPGAALALFPPPACCPESLFDPFGSLLVQAASSVPALTMPPTARKRRRPRPSREGSVIWSSFYFGMSPGQADHYEAGVTHHRSDAKRKRPCRAAAAKRRPR